MKLQLPFVWLKAELEVAFTLVRWKVQPHNSISGLSGGVLPSFE